MSLIASFSESPWLAPLAAALVHFLWQGTLLGAAASLSLATMRTARAEARYWTAVFFLLLMAAAPMATFWTLSPRAALDVRISSRQPVEVEALLAQDRMEAKIQPALTDVTAETATAGVASISKLPWRTYVAVAWMAGVGLMSIRFMAAAIFALRLRWCGVSAAQSELAQQAAILARRLGVWTPWTIGVSTLAKSPLVVGWLRPMILLPAAALTNLTASELEAVLLHELAHLRRFDLWINFAQTVVETALFFHPAVWWLSRKVTEEREHCCDDLAVSQLGDRLTYVKTLLALAELPRPQGALVAAAAGGSVAARIRRLYEPPVGGAKSARAMLPLAALLVAMACIMVFASAKGIAKPITEPIVGPIAKPPSAPLGSPPSPPNNRVTAQSHREPTTEDNPGLVSVIVRAGGDVDRKPNLQLWYATPPDKDSPPSSPRPTSEWVDAQGVAWNTMHSSQKTSSEGVTSLEPTRAGRFRVSAFRPTSSERGGSAVFSAAFEWKPGGTLRLADLVFAPAQVLKLRFIDKASQKPIEGIEFRVFDPNGDIVHGENAGRVSLMSGEKGESNQLIAPPGSYTIEVLGKTEWSYRSDVVDYPRLDERIKLEIPREKGLLKVIELVSSPVPQEVIDQRWPWIVQGKVTNEKGEPIQGARIYAATGMGSLRSSLVAHSGKDGSYYGRFAQGFFSSGDVQMQYALVSAYGAGNGLCEANLNRQGAKWMARKSPSAENLKLHNAKAEEVFLPGMPLTIDFVLKPAEFVSGQVVDEAGKPLEGYWISLVTDPLPPGASVFGQATSHAEGRFTFLNLPVDKPFRFVVSSPAGAEKPFEYSSDSISFTEFKPSHDHTYRITIPAKKGEEEPKLKVESTGFVMVLRC